MEMLRRKGLETEGMEGAASWRTMREALSGQ